MLSSRTFGRAPTAAEIADIARRSLDALSEPFAAHLQDIVLLVEELADDDTLAELDIDDPYQLTGLYHGVDIAHKSSSDSGALPDRIILYRSAILNEWADGETSLEQLVHHIVIHEVGHHLGLSDADMHRIEQEPR